MKESIFSCRFYQVKCGVDVLSRVGGDVSCLLLTTNVALKVYRTKSVIYDTIQAQHVHGSFKVDVIGLNSS